MHVVVLPEVYHEFWGWQISKCCRDLGLAGCIWTEDWKTEWLDGCGSLSGAGKTLVLPLGERTAHSLSLKRDLCREITNCAQGVTLQTREKRKALVLSKVSKKGKSKIYSCTCSCSSKWTDWKSQQNQCEIHREAKAFYHHVWFKSELL